MEAEPEETTTATVVVTNAADRMAHMIYVDGPNSGGHLSGTGNPGKTEFPLAWGENGIRNAIAQIVQSGRTIGPARNAGSVQMEGVVDGVTIQVIVDPVSGQVTTAYPISGPRVVQNPR
jgi:filamentous hemagglutinin